LRPVARALLGRLRVWEKSCVFAESVIRPT
jgi:hypothetical protein